MIKSCAMGSCIKVVKYIFLASYQKKKVVYRLIKLAYFHAHQIMEGNKQPLINRSG
jgi:hypothetical protein